jgi:hypothetical protein
MTTTEPQFCGFDGEGKPWNDFAEPFEQVRQAAVDVVDVETGDLRLPFHTSSRRPYRQNRCDRR